MSGVLKGADDLDALDFSKGDGLVPVVAQHAETGAVLMVAYADREALRRTFESGELHLRSRSRGPWHKGATSGNVMAIVAMYSDCDSDSVLALVRPAGPACHTGTASCFDSGADAPHPFGEERGLARLDRTIAARATGGSHAGSYTRRLLDDRNLRLKKIGEEAAELAVALADSDRAQAVEEAADLLYHVLVGLRGAGAGLADVEATLDRRAASAAAARATD